MFGFEVLLDGKKICLAGVEDPGTVHVSLSRGPAGTGKRPSTRLHVGGVGPARTLAEGTEALPAELLEWVNMDGLDVKQLEVRIVAPTAVDEPQTRRPAQPARGACLYCGKKEREVRFFMFAKRGNICGECITQFAEHMNRLGGGAT